MSNYSKLVRHPAGYGTVALFSGLISLRAGAHFVKFSLTV